MLGNAFNLAVSAYETARRIAVGPRPPGYIPPLPSEILYLICAELVEECLVDCMLNPYMFQETPDPEVTNYLQPTLLSLTRSCSTLRSIVLGMLVDVLCIDRQPDGSLSRCPWKLMDEIYESLKHLRLEIWEPDLRESFSKFPGNDGLSPMNYEATIRLMFIVKRSLTRHLSDSDEYRHPSIPASRYRQTEIFVKIDSIKCNIEVIAETSRKIRLNLRCPPVVQKRLVQRANEIEFNAFSTFHLCRISQELFSKLKDICSPEFEALTTEDKAILTKSCSLKAVEFLRAENVFVPILSKHDPNLLETRTQFSNDTILYSGAILVALYMKEKGMVLNNVDLPEIGRQLFSKWSSRMQDMVIWRLSMLQVERFHARLAEYLPHLMFHNDRFD